MEGGRREVGGRYIYRRNEERDRGRDLKEGGREGGRMVRGIRLEKIILEYFRE